MLRLIVTSCPRHDTKALQEKKGSGRPGLARYDAQGISQRRVGRQADRPTESDAKEKGRVGRLGAWDGEPTKEQPRDVTCRV